MPRAEGAHSNFLCSIFANSGPKPPCSRNSQGDRQCDEVERPAAPAVVLPSLREAMQGREWIQVPRRERVASAADARRGGARGEAYLGFLDDVPERVRCATF